jgi:putative flippase GtrA
MTTTDDSAEDQRAFMLTMRRRFIAVGWLALLANAALTAERVYQRQWISAVCAVLTTLVVAFSLHVFYRFKTWV